MIVRAGAHTRRTPESSRKRVSQIDTPDPASLPRLGASLRELVRNELDRTFQDGSTYRQQLAEVIVRNALRGDIRFCRLILDQVEPQSASRTTQGAAATSGRFGGDTDEDSMPHGEWLRCLRIIGQCGDGPTLLQQSAQVILDAIEESDRILAEQDDADADDPVLPDTPLSPEQLAALSVNPSNYRRRSPTVQ